jgi:hypothetical protein
VPDQGRVPGEGRGDRNMGRHAPISEEATVNQKDRILAALKLGPICGSVMASWYINRYAARIYELRSEGYEISRRPCQLHHHDSQQYVYELAEPDQMSLL